MTKTLEVKVDVAYDLCDIQNAKHISQMKD